MLECSDRGCLKIGEDLALALAARMRHFRGIAHALKIGHGSLESRFIVWYFDVMHVMVLDIAIKVT
jgi:hypothetical protein